MKWKVGIDIYTLRAYVHPCFSRVSLFVTLWTVACQVPLSMGFSRQEYWSGFLQGIFSIQGLNLHLSCLLHWQVGSLPLAPPGKPHIHVTMYKIDN